MWLYFDCLATVFGRAMLAFGSLTAVVAAKTLRAYALVAVSRVGKAFVLAFRVGAFF